MDAQERRERAAEAAARKSEAARGRVNKRALELGDEIMRPIGVRMQGHGGNSLTATSRTDLHEQMRDVIDRGKENELYDRQKGWQKGEQ